MKLLRRSSNNLSEKAKKNPIVNSGLILGYDKSLNKAYIVENDTHTLIIGATRSGKTRTIVLPTTGLMALAGESIIFSDPKGEIFHYTYPFLESLGYETVAIDFEDPDLSYRYNFLQTVIDYVNNGEMHKAIDATWDVVSALVGESKGEKIWNNGECSIIACAIMCVVFDNRHRPQFQNLTNVYHFIGKMCTAINNKLPLTKYLEEMPESHPAKSLVDISNVAPSKTRGSFFTSALATLRLFTNPYIHYMTSATNFDFYGAGLNKQAIYIILPDEKSTYYTLASLFVSLHYQGLVKIAKSHGGRLPNRVNYMLDEIGNFAKMSEFPKMITVGGGRGIRFNLFLQDFNQLDEVYGKNIANVIRNNCETWVYLQSDNEETRNEISNKLGSYTIKTHSVSQSSSPSGGSVNTSYNLTGRKLLDAAEIGKINRPYSLVTSRADPTIMYAPDISKTLFNQLFELGDREYNKDLILKRKGNRFRYPLKNHTIPLWGVWNRYIEMIGGNTAQQTDEEEYKTSTTKKMFSENTNREI